MILSNRIFVFTIRNLLEVFIVLSKVLLAAKSIQTCHKRPASCQFSALD
jgi:hypothetical protein